MTKERTYKRSNRFNGESVMLTKEEAEKHDAIFLHEFMATKEDERLGTGGSKHWQEMRNLLDWFYETQCKSLHGSVRLVPLSWP